MIGRTARFWGQHHWVTRPGVTVHINAFNFPCWGMGEKLAQAILAVSRSTGESVDDEL